MFPIKDLLETEQSYAPVIYSVLFVCGFTGLIVYVGQNHNVWLQWMILAHVLTGMASLLCVLPFLYIHFRRTMGFRRPAALLSGVLTIPPVLIFSATGLYMMYAGLTEQTGWLLTTHLWSASLFLLLLIGHLVLHITLLPARRRDQGAGFPSLPKALGVRMGAAMIITLFAVTAAAWAYSSLRSTEAAGPVVENYQYNYGDHPFRPSQTETASGSFVNQREIGDSHRCLGCHKDVGTQWFASAHALAASDPAYVTNINLLADKKGISATRYCEGCHAPVALLTGSLSPGGQHGGIAGTAANHEGVSCMACHGVRSLPHLKGVASFTFEPASEYLFAGSDTPLLARLNGWLIRMKPDQHRIDLGNPLLQDARFCSSCHTQFMDRDMNDWGWVKMQDDYAAWLESPFSRQHEEGFSSESTVRCQDCHMPLVTASDPSADTSGKVRSHIFPAANTMLPLLTGNIEHLENTIEFMQANRLRINIDRPSRSDSQQTRFALDESLRSFEEAPFYYYLGESAELNVIVSNPGVGHDFPGGTIDINEAWIEFNVVDAEGQLVFNSGQVLDDNSVDPNAYFYRSIPVDRTGKHVWKHDLFNMVGESFKRVVPAGGSDIAGFKFDVPAWVKSPLTVSAILKYRKLNDRYARWALQEKYQPLPIVDVAWDSLTIPVRIRREVGLLNP